MTSLCGLLLLFGGLGGWKVTEEAEEEDEGEEGISSAINTQSHNSFYDYGRRSGWHYFWMDSGRGEWINRMRKLEMAEERTSNNDQMDRRTNPPTHSSEWIFNNRKPKQSVD